MRMPLLSCLLLLACGAPAQDPETCSRFSFRTDPVPSSGAHLACGSASCGNGLQPPTAGPHCGSTLSCRTFDTPQDACVWLHNLEHGHAVFLYDCPEGCPELVGRLEAAAAQAPRGANGVTRALVAPAPGLPTRTAALLWRTAYLADDPDPEALACLLAQQDALAPEPGLSCAP